MGHPCVAINHQIGTAPAKGAGSYTFGYIHYMAPGLQMGDYCVDLDAGG
jgi:hypothetical protein